MARKKSKRKVSTSRAPARRAASSGKKKLTEEQEFKIMLLVLDKFLWLGFGIMALGLFMIVTSADVYKGVSFMVAGAVLLVIFMILVIKEYEIMK